ncbi:MAG: DUF58 domain-containing protein [Opitutae bacterium]|nr:DUF58 domain-containing protein [Opitutae bacterium]
MQIRSLELRSQVVVQGFWNGIHRSPYHGFSAEFTEYRQYVPGDDTRYLDWRLLARSDRFYIKKFEDETNLRCHLLLDQSRSMTFGSLDWTKADYAHTLAATLAYFLFQQGDAVGLLSFDENIRDYLPAKNRPGHLRQLMLSLEKPAGGKSTDLSKPLRRIVELVNKRGLIVLVSDLLTPLDELERQLGRLTATGHDVVVFRVLDPQEVNFDYNEALLFHDVETESDFFIDPAAARRKYLGRFEEHGDSLRSICNKLGAEFLSVTTDLPLDRVLSDFLRQRRRRGKSIRRHANR